MSKRRNQPVTEDSSVVKVLFVNTPTDEALGADAWVHAQIMASLDRERHEIIVACVDRTSRGDTPLFRLVSEMDGIRFVNVAPGPRRPHALRLSTVFRTLADLVPAVTSFVRLVWIVRREQVDIVHTSDRPRDAVLAVVLAAVTRARSIVHVHVLFADWMGPMLRWAIRRADARIAVSEFVQWSLLDAGMSGESTHVVLNAVALQDWTPGVGRSAARAEFGYAPDDLVVLTVCRLFAEKGPEELIRAVAALREEVPRVRLLVVGEDNESSQAFAHRLRNLVIETDLGGCVIFAGRRSDVPALMAGADVFAMPSFEEPFGLVFAEAMAMELPVVALDSGGAPEVLVHGENGLLSRPGDLDGLVANLATLLGDPDLRRAMGRSGRRRVEKRFVVERQGRDVAAVYRLVSSGRSVRPGGGCGGGFDGRRD